MVEEQCACGKASVLSAHMSETASGCVAHNAQLCTNRCFERSNLINAGQSRHDLLFSTPALPAQPQTISCMHFVLSTFSILFLYLIPNPFSHE